jgi:prepilin-type N-terminal cleavage/methylation domain-containing protein
MPTSTRTPSSEVRDRASPSAAIRSAAVRGFTLLELSIVLLILAIAASFVIPRLRSADSTALTSGAARLATTARYLYEEAAFRRRPMRLNLDLDKQTYWVTVLKDDPDNPDESEFVLDDSPLARPTVLPPSVAFADVVLPTLGVVREGLVFAQFFPEGYADPLVVHLTNTRHEFATLALEPLTGRTRVADAYVDLDARRVADARDPSHDDGGGTQGRSSMLRRGAGPADAAGRDGP